MPIFGALANARFFLISKTLAYSHDVKPSVLILPLFSFFRLPYVFRPTIKLDVLTRASASEHNSAHALLNKFVHNANAQSANIQTKETNDKAHHKRSIIKELKTFLAASPNNKVLTALSSKHFSNDTIIEILGHTLGEQALVW